MAPWTLMGVRDTSLAVASKGELPHAPEKPFLAGPHLA